MLLAPSPEYPESVHTRTLMCPYVLRKRKIHIQYIHICTKTAIPTTWIALGLSHMSDGLLSCAGRALQLDSGSQKINEQGWYPKAKGALRQVKPLPEGPARTPIGAYEETQNEGHQA